ncbi:hypothetical protein DL98DRAFT_600192 [Cadophora sp. DSE1049]|nr:hypothetical protein DL98DRAFT_600192 [Cadophora sp. DSE1049]
MGGGSGKLFTLIEFFMYYVLDWPRCGFLGSSRERDSQYPYEYTCRPKIEDVHGKEIAIVWSPAETLHGHLEIRSVTDIDVSDIRVFFEGFSRSYIYIMPEIALLADTLAVEHQFHSQIEDVPSSSVSRTPSSLPAEFVYSVPYHFVIARKVLASGLYLPLQCSQLPPTMDLGHVLTNERNWEKSVIGGVLGMMTVATQEPSPLKFDPQATEGSTTCQLKFEIPAIGSSNTHDSIHGALAALSITINSLIFVVETLLRHTCESLLSSQSGSRLRDKMIKLEKQTLLRVPWTFVYDSITHLQGQTQSLWNESTADTAITVGPKTRGQMKQLPSGKWSATFDLPVCAKSRLLPTFCSSLVARLYAITICIKIGGRVGTSFTLEVPLQVVHTPPIRLAEFTVRIIEEHLASLGTRRESETSWFGDRSTTAGDEPPTYHP